MFDFCFSRTNNKAIEIDNGADSLIGKRFVPLVWTEHCIECAAPKCYSTCPRYQRRLDGHCVRIVNGISPLYLKKEKGAVVEFRTWAKIEAQLTNKPITKSAYSKLSYTIYFIGKIVKCFATILPGNRIKRIINDGWFSVRQKIINRVISNKVPCTSMVLHGYVGNEDKSVTLLVDVKTSSKLLYRESVDISKGCTSFDIPIPVYDSEKELHFINIHPSDAERHVKLDFYNLEMIERNRDEGKTVKCVIWDLDNTLWDGVLIESDHVHLRTELVDLIKRLDQKGIVNSIVSKNNEEQVVEKLREWGIDDYFVFKKINWNPKSVNLNKTIQQMNINPNTIVFVDDNPFERLEVSLRHPSVTCVDPSEIEAFSQGIRFNTSTTKDGQKRRETYKMLEALKKEEENWDGDIDDFLKSCNIKVSISNPEESEIKRCHELLQRTNQLNSSGRRLSYEQVERIVHDDNYDSYLLRSSDRFGDYGIVGFIIVNKEPVPSISDFVISCRVANKKIEPTIINYLSQRYNNKIDFIYKKTTLNGPIFNAITELGMVATKEEEEHVVYTHNFLKNYLNLIEITDYTK